jgi:hypothetical protein
MMYVILGVWCGLLLVFAGGYFTGRGVRLDRQAARADLQMALDRSASSYQPPPPSYGRFPVDTGPLLILGEKEAALAAHEREVAAMIREAERTMLWR